jgi:hypothetical protein
MGKLSSSAAGRPYFSLGDRFEFGNFTVAEVRELKQRSHSGFYEDLKAGLVKIEKVGTKTIIRGPIARAYIAGEPIASTSDQEAS